MLIILGAVVGYLLLHGAIGAVVGAGAAWMLGRYLRGRERIAKPSEYVEPLFAVLGAVAKADGRVSQSEIAVAERLMDRLRLAADLRQAAINGFNRGKQPGFDAEPAMQRLRQWVANRRDRAHIVIDVVLETILAEGPTQPKLDILGRLAGILRISQMELMAMMAMRGYAWNPGGAGAGPGAGRQWQGWQGGAGYRAPRPTSTGPDPYVVLGVDREADERTVKRAYRKLISQHHPDRLGDLPDDLRKRAEQRAAEINAAYERIREERGFK